MKIKVDEEIYAVNIADKTFGTITVQGYLGTVKVDKKGVFESGDLIIWRCGGYSAGPRRKILKRIRLIPEVKIHD